MIVVGRARLFVLLPMLMFALGSLVTQAQTSVPRAIALEDYATVKRITGAGISADGKWMHYTVTPNDGDGTLFVKSLDGDTVYDVPRGANPAFSENGRWIGYFIAPPAAEARGRGRGGRGGQGQGGAGTEAPPTRPFEVIDLTTGIKSSFPSVANFAFSPDGEWLLMRPTAPTAAPARNAASSGPKPGNGHHPRYRAGTSSDGESSPLRPSSFFTSTQVDNNASGALACGSTSHSWR